MKLLPRTRALVVAGALVATATLSGAAVGTGAVASAAVECATSSAGGGGSARSRDGYSAEADTMSPARAAAVDAAVAAIAARNKGKKAAPTTVTIRVRAHVIKGVGSTGGGIKQQGLIDTVAQLNRAYGGEENPAATNTRFRFELASVDTTTNDNWYRKSSSSPSNKYTTNMKNKLHVGGAKALNLYFVKFSSDLLGFATFPDRYASKPLLDGVVIDLRTRPGGPLTSYSGGDTATHEVGHWLGLRHVFNDYATGSPENPKSADCVDNDEGNDAAGQINDTVIQAYPTGGCTTSAYLCSQANGKDNKHNYMDYSYDDCMYLFTPDQSTYMSNAFDLYRAG